ncbi:MAG: hypothetical protein ACOYI4_05090 [Christensenellales bacterium]
MNFGIALLQGAVPEGRVFALDQQTLVSTGIQLLNVLALAIILGLILYKPVQKFMQNRTNRISGQLDDARDKLSEADSLKTKYEKKLGEIDKERVKILEAARHAAAERSKHILDEARSEAASIKRRTQQSILNEKERLKKETKLHIIEASSLMARKFVQHTIDQDTQDRLYDETMAELEETTWLN